jgi:hypothetical protein
MISEPTRLRMRGEDCGLSRSGSRSVTFLSLCRWQRCPSACSPNTSLIALRSALTRIASHARDPDRGRRGRRAASRQASRSPMLRSQSPSGIFTPSVLTPRATTCVRSTISSPSSSSPPAARHRAGDPSAHQARCGSATPTPSTCPSSSLPARSPRRPARPPPRCTTATGSRLGHRAYAPRMTA